MGRTPEKPRSVSRRRFVRQAAALSSLPIITSCTTSSSPFSSSTDLKEQQPDSQTRKTSNAMPKRRLGRTGMNVSVLGFGGGSRFMNLNDGKWEPLLEKAVELGVNWFDTCSDYDWNNDHSERRFGQILAEHRDNVYLCTKFNNRDPEKAKKEFEGSLGRLKTDYVDCLMLHGYGAGYGIGGKDTVAATEKAWKWMQSMKDQGAAKSIGLSAMKKPADCTEFVKAYDPDVAMMQMDLTSGPGYEEKVIPLLRENDAGIILMKLLRNIVSKERPAEKLFVYAMGIEGAACGVVGHAGGVSELEKNYAIFSEFDATGTIDRSVMRKELSEYARHNRICYLQPDYRDNGKPYPGELA